MLLKEFLERTGLNVAPENYAEIESVYSEMTCDKDTFCNGWLCMLNDEFVCDLFNTVIRLRKEYLQLGQKCSILECEKEIEKAHYDEEMKERSELFTKEYKEFAKKILRQASNESLNNIYNVIEEEFGYAFIIKSKREMGIPLTDGEIDYLVGKL